MLSLIIDLMVIKKRAIQFSIQIQTETTFFKMDEDFVPRQQVFWNIISKKEKNLPSLLNKNILPSHPLPQPF